MTIRIVSNTRNLKEKWEIKVPEHLISASSNFELWKNVREYQILLPSDRFKKEDILKGFKQLELLITFVDKITEFNKPKPGTTLEELSKIRDEFREMYYDYCRNMRYVPEHVYEWISPKEKLLELMKQHKYEQLASGFYMNIDKLEVSNNEFMCLCANGYLGPAKWLYSNFANIDPFDHLDSVFILVCTRGFYDMANWLYYDVGYSKVAKDSDIKRVIRRVQQAGMRYHIISPWLRSLVDDPT